MSEEPVYTQRFYDLVQELRLAKVTENVAKKKRVALEEEIATLVPTKDEGQKTVEAKGDDGQVLKVTVKRGLNYRADLAEIEKFFGEESPSDGHHFLAAPVKQKSTRELDIKGYEWYRESHPEIFACFSEYVTVTPKKPAVTIKV
ncbi:MAG: hypothetical protein GY906_23930 [bacterium]|nr:hypothetical protein [bacterium]